MSDDQKDFNRNKRLTKKVNNSPRIRSIAYKPFINKALIIFILFFVSNSSVFAQNNAAAAKRAYDQGMTFYKQDTNDGYFKAIENLNQARNIYQQVGDSDGEALTLFRIGQSYKKLNYLQDAYDSYFAAYNIYKQLGKKKEMVFASQNVASILKDSGQFQNAIQIYETDVFPAMKTVGSKKDIARAYNGLGQSYLGIGDDTQALSNFKLSLANWGLVKERDYDKVRATYGSAVAYYRLGNKTASKTFGNRALSLSRQENDPVFEVEVLEALARVYDDDGDKKTSVQYRLQALQVYDKAKGRVSIHSYESVANNLADVYYRMGELDAAYKLLTANVIKGVNGKDRPNQTYLAATLGEVLTAQGKYDLAIESLNASIRIAQEANDKHSEAYALACLGEVYLYIAYVMDNDYTQAIRTYQKALSFYKPGENPYVETKVISGLILAYNAKNETASARKLVERIQNAGMEKGNSVSAILALGAIGKYYSFLGQHNEAMSYYNAASKLAFQRKNLFLLAQTTSNANISLLTLGNFQQVFDNYKEMIPIYKNFGNKDFESFANLGAAWASLYLNQFDQATFYANNALELTRNENKPKLQSDMQINSLHIFGKVNFAKRNYETAVDYFKKCLEIAENTNDKAGQKHFWQDLEQTYTALGDNKNAKNARKKADKIK